MYTSLSEAAKATGKSRATIQRAIKAGKISAPKDEHGNYAIQPAELHRIYPKQDETSHGHVHETLRNSDDTAGNSNDLRLLEAKLEASERMAEERERELRHRDQTIDDLRERLDREGEERRKLTAMIADMRPKEPATPALPDKPRGLWARLRGR
ncbi:MAG: hypothetical protein KDK08_03420 [Rhizobiaceae bacterium]|nr:hypothetical protein [Rhizobiaceae bacterium]